MSIGSIPSPIQASALLPTMQKAATSLEPLLLQAHQLAHMITSGWHGRRRQGRGDSFWQFRPHQSGEAATRIDWRRSARGHNLYIREREWEAAQTVFLCPDLSLSMRYQSRFALHSKEERVILLCLVLAEILSRAGDLVGVPHLLNPTHARHSAERLALALHTTNNKQASFDLTALPPQTCAIIISDFLDSDAERQEKFAPLLRHHIKAHLIEIADPAELHFPYRGHVEFHLAGKDETIRLERAEQVAQDYKKLYLARRATVKAWAHQHNWSFYSSVTDKPLTSTLHHLYLHLISSRG